MKTNKIGFKWMKFVLRYVEPKTHEAYDTVLSFEIILRTQP